MPKSTRRERVAKQRNSLCISIAPFALEGANNPGGDPAAGIRRPARVLGPANPTLIDT